MEIIKPFEIESEIRDFTYITNIFKFIEGYNRIGHQIGRKVGDMLEVLTLGVISKDPQLLERLIIEDGLEGYTSGKHKVEFGLFNDVTNKEGLFGSIECKCVGVEVTKDGKKNERVLKVGESHITKFQPKWLPVEKRDSVSLEVVEITSNTVKLKFKTSKFESEVIEIDENNRFIYIMDEHGEILILEPSHNLYNEVPNLIREARVIKIKEINSDSIKIELYKCLTGPQTIEKAKQASLVAMDLRKKIDGVWGKEEIKEEDKSIISVLVLCEFSHWEVKSRNVIKCCIDHNLIIPDEIIIASFKEFEKEFGAEEMLDTINKKSFTTNKKVREIVFKILSDFNDKILYDIELKSYVKFQFNDGKLYIETL